MTDQEPQRKKGGRPRKHSPDAKRPTMAFRMSSRLHELLIASAAESERSLSEEIERRLEQGFQDTRDQEFLAGCIAKEAKADASATISRIFGGDENMLAVNAFASRYAFLAARMRAERAEGDDARRAFADSCAAAAREVAVQEFEMRATLDWARSNDPALAEEIDPARRVEDMRDDWHDETDPRVIVEAAKAKARSLAPDE